ncbi:MAG: hypothetical protein LPK02_07005 [Rhodobacterales bacterium]|nr:hypothetical protein [Rhodobacterales bacterium]
MALDFSEKTGPRTYFYSGNTSHFMGEMSRADFDANDLLCAQSVTPKFIGGTSFFYSCAQHVLIGSYLAEDLYGRDLAKAYLGITIPRHYMGNINRELIAHMPELYDMETRIGRAVLQAYGIDPALWRNPAMEHVEAIVSAVEFRDLKPFSTPPSDLPTPCPNVVINYMTPGQAYLALAARCHELFPDMNLTFNHEHLPPEDVCRQVFVSRL